MKFLFISGTVKYNMLESLKILFSNKQLYRDKNDWVFSIGETCKYENRLYTYKFIWTNPKI